jgi:hypothetical protein
MKNNIIKYMACAAMALGLAATVQAAQITGGVSLGGGTLTTDSGNLNGAHSLSFSGITTVVNASGSYTGILGDQVEMFNLTFNPAPLSGTPVWLTTPGGVAYYFLITSLNIDNQTSSVLDLSGTGTLHIDGDTDTIGGWVFTANSLGDTFSFSSSNGVNVPDGGTTALLLGTALSAMGLIRRKLA